MKPAQLQSSSFNIFFITLLEILLFFPPLFKGLFITNEWLLYQLLIGIAILFLVLFKPYDRNKIAFTTLDLTMASLLLAYILSVFTAVNIPGAISETYKYITYFLIFYMVSCSVSTVKDITSVLKTFYFSGVIVLLITLATAFGSFYYPGAFVDGRMYSTLEYANTFAAYTICLFFLGLYFAGREQKKVYKIAYTLTNFLFLISFFGSKSRGGLLVFLVMLLIYFVGLPVKYRFKLSTQTAFSGLLAYLFINYVLSPLPVQSSIFYWSILALICLMVIAPTLLNISNLKIKLSLMKNKGKIITYTGMVLLGIVLFFAVVTGITSKNKPVNSEAVNRFSKISLSASEAQHRLVYYQDALKIAGDYPILGTGGLGWRTIYPQYQGFSYTVTDIHNHYLQVLVESGALGLIAFISIWVVVIQTSVKLLRKVSSSEDKLQIWSILCASLVLGLHSLLDVDLSIPAVAILLWGLFGCLRAWQKLTNSENLTWNFILPSKGKVIKYVLVVLSLVFLATSTVLLMSSNYGKQGLVELSQGSYITAQEHLNKTVIINPLASNYWAALSETLTFQGNNYPHALEYIDKAIILEPRNPDFRIIKGKILALLGKVDQAVNEFEQAGKLRPYHQKYVDTLAEAYLKAGSHYFTTGDKAKAKIYLAKAKNYPEVVAKRINKIEPKHKKIQSPKVKLVISEIIKDSSQRANDLLAN